MGFVKSFSRYRSGNDEEVWTQLFTGVPIIVNRLHSDSFSVSSPFVGIIGGVQPGMLRKFADGKTESGFIYRWLFAYPDKRTFPRFQDDEIDDKILSRWNTIIDTIRKIRYNGKTTVIRFCPEAYDLYKLWYNTGRETMKHASTSYIGITTKMECYCARFALILEVLRYTCGQSDLTSVFTTVKASPSPSSTQCQNAHSKTGSRQPSSRNSTTEPTKDAANNINSYPFALSALFALFHQFPYPKVQRIQRMQSGKK